MKKRSKLLAVAALLLLVVVGLGLAYWQRDELLARWWLHRLENGDVAARREACHELARLGAESAAPALAKAIEDDSEIQDEAVAALLEMRGEAYAALLDLLERASQPIQELLSLELVEVRSPLSDLLRRLAARVHGEEPSSAANVLRWVHSELVHRGLSHERAATLAVLRDSLGARRGSVVLESLSMFQEIALTEEDVAALIEPALRHPDDAARTEAVRLLGLTRGESLVVFILEALGDRAPAVREMAARSLANFPLHEVPEKLRVGLSRALVEALHDEAPKVVESAASALILHDRKAALAELARGSPELRSTLILQLMASPGPDLRAPIAAMLEAVRAQETPDDASLRLAPLLVSSLVELGPGRPPVAPLVRRLATHPSLELAWPAIVTLGDLRPVEPDTLALLRKLLAVEELGTRQRAVLALGRLGREGSDAAPELIALLADPELAGHAADALAALGPESFEPLRARLDDPDELTRIAVLEALANLEADDPEAQVEVFASKLEDESARVRHRALSGLDRHAGIDFPEAIFARLEDEDPALRFFTARIIAKRGPPLAAKAIPALLAVARDKELVLSDRRLALDALAEAEQLGVEPLVGLLADLELRRAVLEVLGAMGPIAQATTSAVEALEAEPGLQELVKECLRRLEPREAEPAAGDAIPEDAVPTR